MRFSTSTSIWLVPSPLIKESFWLKEITQKQLVLMGISDAKSMIRTVNKRITTTFMLIHGRSRDESSFHTLHTVLNGSTRAE